MPTIPLTGEPTPLMKRTHLCPRCTDTLIEDQYTCPNCSLVFKNKAKARKLSYLWPGGGYFYTRHYVMGTMDAFGEILLLIALSASIMDMVNQQPGGVENSIFWGILMLIEKLGTIYHSNNFINEFIPEDKTVTPFTDADFAEEYTAELITE